MKDYNVFKHLNEVGMKYVNRGLTIDIEFSRFDMILRGVWDLTVDTVELEHFNKAYSYALLENLPDDFDIEQLVDDFKAEFENMIRNKENKSE